MTMENEAHTILVVEGDEALLLLLMDYRLSDMICKQVVETLDEQQRSIQFIYMPRASLGGPPLWLIYR